MSLQPRDSTFKDGVPYARSGGSWMKGKKMFVRSGGVWVENWADYVEPEASAAPSTDWQSILGPGECYSDDITCSVTDGEAPFSYLWEKVSGDTLNISSSTSAVTTFWLNSVVDNVTRMGVYRCKVTDNRSNVAYSNNVEITLEWMSEA